MNAVAAKRKKGFSLVEAVVSCFIALAATLIYASAMPLANNSRSKAEKANIALSLAKKELESITSYSFANVRVDQLNSAGLLDTQTPVDLSTTMLFGPSGYEGYECTNVDLGMNDNPSKLLPDGRAFVHLEDEDTHTRRVDVLVFWSERGIPRYIKLSRVMVSF